MVVCVCDVDFTQPPSDALTKTETYNLELTV